MEMNGNPMRSLAHKTAVVNSFVPPVMFGSAGKTYRIFRHVEPGDYCLVTTPSGQVLPEGGNRLPCEYNYLPSEWRRIRSLPGCPQSVVSWMDLWLKIIQRARNVARILREQNCRAVVTFSGECEDLPSAFLASCMAGCRFYPVLDDDYVNQWSEPHKRWVARQMFPSIARKASRLFVVSDAMREEYSRRYGKLGHVLNMPTLDRVGESPSEVPMNGETSILFAGTIYQLNASIVGLLVEAAARVDGRSVRVHLYTWQTRAQLDALGVGGEYMLHASRTPEEIQTIQRGSGIVFLGLGFDARHGALVQTSFPSKLTDYLVSGRPILAIAPPSSPLALFLRKHQCGHLVETPDVGTLAAGIRRLLEDHAYRVSLVRNAFEIARKDFDWPVVVGEFAGAINEMRHIRQS